MATQDAKGAAPALYLPGRLRKEQQDEERPLTAAGVDECGHLVVVVNAQEFKDRIPRDELRDMLADRMKKRKTSGYEQRAADINAALLRFWEGRKDWVVHRRNNAVRMGWTPGLENGGKAAK